MTTHSPYILYALNNCLLADCLHARAQRQGAFQRIRVVAGRVDGLQRPLQLCNHQRQRGGHLDRYRHQTPGVLTAPQDTPSR